jgi:putative flavoprotein involved in K+ transport
MTNTLSLRSSADPALEALHEVLSLWVVSLREAVAAQDVSRIEALFRPDATFRDLLARSWDFRNAVGNDNIAALLAAAHAHPLSIDLRPDADIFHSCDGEDEETWTFLCFETEVGSGTGYVRLIHDPDGIWRASALILTLTQLGTHPEQLGDNRPAGKLHGAVPKRRGWQESLDHEFQGSEPTVVILGAGHNGLSLAARLRVLGISALVIETNDRVGDNWRKRYTSLALHTPIEADELPYMSYPSTWTRFTPKDKLADFLESYAKLLDLPVWTGSRAENIQFNDAIGRWTLDVVRPDASRRQLTPAHLVLAVGNNAEPIRPQLPGRHEFGGTVMHAVDYRGWCNWVGKTAVVVGSGVSGHDIAQDLAEHGVDVTMIQRSPTVVLDVPTVHATLYGNHTSGTYSLEDSDLMNASIPFGVLASRGPRQVAVAKELDRELLDGLERAGFELSDGPDGQGVLGLIFGQNTTGYYYNVGASQMISDGRIGLRHGSVTAFTRDGITLDDRTTINADVVVFATGYRDARTAVRRLFGDVVADTLGEFAVVGKDGEFGRLWRHSGLDRLWFMMSLGIDHGRFYSRLLALQIAAIEAGTLPIARE